jgi:hypothetical protein
MSPAAQHGEHGPARAQVPSTRHLTLARKLALVTAAVLLLALVVLHALGARELVGTLSGTAPAGQVDVALGGAYVVAWFGGVLVAPVLVLAVIFDAACGTLAARLREWRASHRR